MTSDDDANAQIPELIESLEPILTVPDPAVIRSEASRRRTMRQRVGAIGVAAVLVASLGAFTAFGGDEPTQTETVAADSPPRPDEAVFEFEEWSEAAAARLLETEWLVASSENPAGINSWRVIFSGDTVSIGTGCSTVVHEIDWDEAGFTTGKRLPDVDVFTHPFADCGYSLQIVELVAAGEPVEVVFPRDAPDKVELRGTGEADWTVVLVPDPAVVELAWDAGDDTLGPLMGNSYGIRWSENIPISVPARVGHLSFDARVGRLEFTVGCSGASYQVTAAPEGFVIDRVNPEPVVAGNVSCAGEPALLSPFSDGDVVRVVPSLLDDAFDLFVEGETSWSMRIDGTDWPWSADRFGGRVGLPFTVLAEDVEEGGPYSVELIDNPERFGELGLSSEVDFESHVVIVFDLAESSSLGCEFQPMQELVFDAAERRLYPLVLMRDQSAVGEGPRCRADAGAHRIVVSVAKRDLPDTVFTVWINEGEPPTLVGDAPLQLEAGRFRN